MRKIDVYFDEIEIAIKQIKCEVLRRETTLFFQKHKNEIPTTITGNHVALYFLITNLSNINIKEINWKTCVQLHNLVLYEELIKNKRTLPESLKTIIIQYYEVYKSKNSSNGLFLYQKYINDFYSTLHDHLGDRYTNINEIKYYKKLLVSGYRNHSNIFLEHKDKEIFWALTNYPSDGDYTKLVKVPKGIDSGNYWLNTNSNFIKEQVGNYLDNYAANHLPPILYRLVGYFFVDSVNKYNFSINSYEEITDSFLKFQTEYFNSISSEVIEKVIPKNPNLFINQLIIFYRIMLDTAELEQKKVDLSKIYINLLKLKEATTVFKGNYEPVYYNPNESIPKHEKIAVISNEYTRVSANAKKSDINFLNFSGIKKQVRSDILEFIWFAPGSFYSKNKHLKLIKDFFAFLEKESKLEHQSSFNFQVGINHQILFKYRQKLELKYSNTSTLKSVLKVIRKILIYFCDKYEIIPSMLNILNLKGLEKANGGRPISNNDFKIIYEGFKALNDKDKLSIIIFEIFSLTNLRIGEILNLERDCIDFKDSTGKANIRYLSKTSNQDYISQMVSEKVTYLIEEAIRITSPIMFDDSRLSMYIFIELVERKVNKKLKMVNFAYVFNKVIEDIQDELEYKNYTVNNLRHTYINNVYKKGLQLNYSLPKLAAITNNGYKTAKMYYRKYNEIGLYVEALSGVTLTNVDVNGEIRQESNTEFKNNVKSNLGQCKENSCVFEAMECLICPHFVTFTNRIPKFEKKIDELNNTIKKTSNPIVIDEAISQKKLLSQYLTNMIALEEN